MRGFEIVSKYQLHGISLPRRKTQTSAGYDLAAAAETWIKPGALAIIETGLKAYMPDDEFLGIHIRSGLAVKQCLSLINGQGIVDSDYYNNPDNEGHIMIAIFNHGQQEVYIEKGSRIAQGIFQKYLLTDTDNSHTGVRMGGFGSTGTR